MRIRKDKRDFLVSVFGEERTTAIERALERKSRDLEEAGVGWKELGEALRRHALVDDLRRRGGAAEYVADLIEFGAEQH